ncbi:MULTISPECIES: DNA gyrase subunit A [Actinotignum]|uniref:DNA gyrase subunit A n=2 Tax=Actinotignum timonense TaxID=1870995 RepID=A0AAW9HNL3_9ACTO|nr:MULTISPECIES: DNA gyrase subunit A [Actinotignum]MBS5748053.1 DNA gyrase subunit A [Actinotignum schaalii]MDE1558768.1 DNA gyrase subunit A [Actinotignum schaalii]MDE1663684.1 DNA gyrase subunit A [Actinotignum schaalii]MDK6419891.1 DNA gyrase subunit A [Actinotignum timonense]MDK6590848.1 DNA gyrase subunit A [Actinotignum timonense]
MSESETTSTYNHGAIMEVDLQREMESSYLDYAMSVIVGRALPDVRDGLKPVHRRVIYAMYDGGYRPDSSFSKSAKIVGDVMGHYHPHGDAAIYDTMVRLAQPWSMRYPLVSGQGNFGTSGDLGAAAPRYTEARMAPLALEMVRDIKENTVDFEPNYDGSLMEPTILTSRFPNLLVNGSEGIAVGMATRIPPHNLREVNDGVQWYLAHPDTSREELLGELMRRIKGPDFPTGATILGTRGIEDAYRTGRGSITQRAVVEVDEIGGRTCLVITDLPYQVNPDRLLDKMVEGIKDGRLPGIADIRDETSGRAGQRIVVVLKRDAVPKVVLNNLYKHTQLQNNFPANMLALVDGVPRTLSLDGFVRHWVAHQMDVIRRRTEYRLNEALKRMHILEGYLKALDALDEVIALIRASATVDVARTGLMELLDIDEDQANAILEMQLRRLAALERQKILDEYEEKRALVEDYRGILASEDRQRSIISEELQAITDKYGDERRTTILPYDGEMSVEDLIPEEDVVVTVTRSGYVKRTKVSEYRAQHRGGKGIRGASLRVDDVVDHFGIASTHDWHLFFTNLGRVYRLKGYELPEGGRDAKGQHVANLLAFQPGETIAAVRSIRSYDDAKYLVLATKSGLVKKTPLQDYDSPRSGGLIAIKLRELADGSSDEVVAASLVDEADDLLLVSRHGMSLRFTADAEALRPMGRAASGVTGMKFRGDDSLLTMDVVHDDSQVFVMTEQGFAKRTSADEYRVQGRAGMGIKVAKLTEARGDLVGALMVSSGDEVLAIMESGKVMRAAVDEVSLTGRNTQGVTFVRPDKGDRIIAVARNAEVEIEEEVPAAGEQPAAEASAESSEAAEVTEPTAAAEDAESTEPAAETLEN